MSMIVVTPSYAPDIASFERLHRSVLRYTDPSVRHLAVVPDADVPRFRSLGSGRLDVLGEREVLPSSFLATPWLARLPRLPRGYRIAAVNPHRPWPPVRSWILQQILKLAVISQLDEQVALHVDSDVTLVRPIELAHFWSDGAVRLYRKPLGIESTMTRHLRWQQAASSLLGLPEDDAESPDYITSFGAWSRDLVRQCLSRVESSTGRHWYDAVGGRLEFSEFILYGTFAHMLADQRLTFESDQSLCHSYWTPEPLDRTAAAAFVASMRPDDVAIHIQSNSHTSEDVLQFVAAALADQR